MSSLWNNETPIAQLTEQHDDLDIEIPPWIDPEITPYDIAAICQGGCASGAYMPAVTYNQARETMAEYGDEIFQYLEDSLGERPEPAGYHALSWDSMACFFVSCAVELWASSVEDELETALEPA